MLIKSNLFDSFKQINGHLFIGIPPENYQKAPENYHLIEIAPKK